MGVTGGLGEILQSRELINAGAGRIGPPDPNRGHLLTSPFGVHVLSGQLPDNAAELVALRSQLEVCRAESNALREISRRNPDLTLVFDLEVSCRK